QLDGQDVAVAVGVGRVLASTVIPIVVVVENVPLYRLSLQSRVRVGNGDRGGVYRNLARTSEMYHGAEVGTVGEIPIPGNLVSERTYSQRYVLNCQREIDATTNRLLDDGVAREFSHPDSLLITMGERTRWSDHVSFQYDRGGRGAGSNVDHI